MIQFKKLRMTFQNILNEINFVSIVNGKKYKFTKTDTIIKNNKGGICEGSCMMSEGGCPEYYSLNTYYLEFKTPDDSNQLLVANTYLHPTADRMFNSYEYFFNSDHAFIRGGFGLRIIDSLIINNKTEKDVIVCDVDYLDKAAGYRKLKSVLYFKLDRKILRYVDLFKKDTLDVID